MKFSAALTATLAATGAAVDYSGHRVYRFTPQTFAELKTLHDAHDTGLLDFWVEPKRLGGTVDVRLSPEMAADLERGNDEHALHSLLHEVMIADVQTAIDAQKAQGRDGDDWFSAYHNHTEIYDWMDDMASTYSDMVSLTTIGSTSEGRNLKVMVIGDPSKPAIFTDHCIHAREWVSSAVGQYLVNGMLTGDEVLSPLLEDFSYHALLMFNVDGYAYTWAEDGDRLWRKNRQENAGSSCVGTDACRNADAGFGGTGSSGRACNDEYHGPSAFSAPEVAAVADYVTGLDDVALYLNVHSYSQLLLSPWGYKSDLPADYDDHMAVMEAGADAIEATHGLSYTYGAVYDTIYPASGAISDYLYDQGIKYSFATELRDTGKQGFTLDADQIVPNGEEVAAGLAAMMKKIQEIEG